MKHLILLIALLLFSTTNYAQDEDLYVTEMHYKDGTLESRTKENDDYIVSAEEFYPNGQLKLKAVFGDFGAPIKSEKYHPNGQLSMVADFNKGLLWNMSGFDEKGNKLDVGTLKNGTGTAKFYENGKVTDVFTYKDGFLQIEEDVSEDLNKKTELQDLGKKTKLPLSQNYLISTPLEINKLNWIENNHGKYIAFTCNLDEMVSGSDPYSSDEPETLIVYVSNINDFKVKFSKEPLNDSDYLFKVNDFKKTGALAELQANAYSLAIIGGDRENAAKSIDIILSNSEITGSEIEIIIFQGRKSKFLELWNEK